MTDDEWKAQHWPAKCREGHEMTVNAISHGCERWRCPTCELFYIRDTPKQGYEVPNLALEWSFDRYVANMERIRPLTDATTTTTCARCAATLEVTDAAAKAHEERCLIPGDSARWWPIASDVERHSDGRIVAMGVFELLTHSGPTWSSLHGLIGSIIALGGYPVGDCRRIPRPESLSASATPLYQRSVAGWTTKSFRTTPAPDPLDILYDGVMLRTLLIADRLQRHDQGDRVPLSRHPLTPVQRDAVSAHWSEQLRAKIAASSERERLTVVAPDIELETANCKDAE